MRGSEDLQGEACGYSYIERQRQRRKPNIQEDIERQVGSEGSRRADWCSTEAVDTVPVD